jgi:hypothetical protein
VVVDGGAASSAVVYSLSETTATGLRKFDLGNVPASVTPPRSWRKAAWFTIGTSAAVVLGLTVATAEFMGRPIGDGGLIDALPAYPSGPLTLAELPNQTTTEHDTERRGDGPATSTRRTPVSRSSTTPEQEAPASRTVTGGDVTSSSDAAEDPAGEAPSEAISLESAAPATEEPTRRTVGAAPLTPTDPQAMGDRTEEYFRLVTTDPEAAHAMTTGGMAREGTAGIEARYGDVARVEVQDITVDRNQAITTSRIKVVHEDGTETVVVRRLTFTWGADPRITEDTITQ